MVWPPIKTSLHQFQIHNGATFVKVDKVDIMKDNSPALLFHGILLFLLILLYAVLVQDLMTSHILCR